MRHVPVKYIARETVIYCSVCRGGGNVVCIQEKGGNIVVCKQGYFKGSTFYTSCIILNNGGWNLQNANSALHFSAISTKPGLGIHECLLINSSRCY